MLHRRDFVALTLAGAVRPLLAGSPDPERTVIINSCGGFDDSVDLRPIPAGQRPPGTGIEPRALADALASGMTAANQTIGYVLGNEDPFEATVRDLGVWASIVRNEPRLLQVQFAADIERAKREQRLGLILGFQNAAMLGTRPERVATFAALGIRICQLTYNNQNLLGGGALTPGDPGLTAYGREVVARLNAERVMVDLSHGGAQLCLDGIRASSQPVAITHTGCRALTDHPRNTSDEALRGVADRGGYVGIYFIPFLTSGKTATADDLIRHIEHAIEVCGEDHVGIGTDGGTSLQDLDRARAATARQYAQRKAAGITAPGESPDSLNFIPELSGPEQFRRLAVRLEQRGHSSALIEKILGQNFLRCARDIWGG